MAVALSVVARGYVQRKQLGGQSPRDGNKVSVCGLRRKKRGRGARARPLPSHHSATAAVSHVLLALPPSLILFPQHSTPCPAGVPAKMVVSPVTANPFLPALVKISRRRPTATSCLLSKMTMASMNLRHQLWKIPMRILVRGGSRQIRAYAFRSKSSS